MTGAIGEMSLEPVSGIDLFPIKVWNSLVGTSSENPSYNPFVSHAFLSALEHSGCVGGNSGWTPFHFQLKSKSGEHLAVIPAYLKSHSQGEYVFDHGWAEAFNRAGGQYYPKLQIAVPFTPASGPRLLVKPGHETLKNDIPGAISRITEMTGLSSAHATFLNEADKDAFKDNGWLLRHDHQFHFINRGYRDYQDFLDTLTSRKRKNLRKERESALKNGIAVELHTGSSLDENVIDAFFAFYMDTSSRKWGRPYLNPTFFSMIANSMPEDILLVMAKRNGRYIAGAINFKGSDRLFGRNWGCIEDHPCLHFEICYHQAIDFAIANKLSVVEAGAQGEHKLDRGYEPVLTTSAHYVVHAGLRQAVDRFLREERAEVARVGKLLALQGPFKKPDSQNAAEFGVTS